MNKKEICRIAQCQNLIHVKKHKLCQGHYNRLCRTGATGKTPIRAKRTLDPFADEFRQSCSY